MMGKWKVIKMIGLSTKTASMPICDKIFKNLLQNQECFGTESLSIPLVCEVYQVCLNYVHRLIFDAFVAKSDLLPYMQKMLVNVFSTEETYYIWWNLLQLMLVVQAFNCH